MHEHHEVSLGFLDNLLAVALSLSPWLLLGAAAAGLIHAFLPRGFVQRAMQGRSGVLRAVLLGIPLPLCSCGVIPATVGLKKDGASDGASVGFLISTPQTGVDSILVSASFLGWPFALFKVFAAFIMGLAGGLLTDLVSPSRPAPAHSNDANWGRRPGLRSALPHALETLEAIWHWLLLGLVISALISTFVPPATMQSFASLGPLGTALVMLLISLPLYVCSTASVPIAAALVAGGMPHGAALVFLVAGPASNAATIGAVFKTFGAKVAWVYLAVVALGSLGLGLAFDGLGLGGSAALGHEHEGGVVAWLSTVVVGLLLLWFALNQARFWLRGRRGHAHAGTPTATEAAGHPQVPPMQSFTVSGMTCQNCARHVQARAAALPGVTFVRVDLSRRRLELQGSVDEAALRKTLQDGGYELES